MAAPGVARGEEDLVHVDTVVGELRQAWVEPGHGVGAAADVLHAPLTWIETDADEAIRIPTDEAAHLPLGATVEVTLGAELADAATTNHGLDSAREVVAAEVIQPAPAESAPETDGTSAVTNEVTVVMMIPSNGVIESGRTVNQVVAAVEGPVHDFWAAESNGTISLGVHAQWDWIQAEADCSDPYALWAEAAAHAGWTEGPGKHLLVYLPQGSPDCSYGLAEVGATPSFGGRMYVTDLAMSLIAHEFGHNFGLGHSGARQCDGHIEAGTCADDDYRDLYDVMGYSWGPVGSLNAGHAAALGVLPQDHQSAVTPTTVGGTYSLAPISGRSGTRGVRLNDSQGRIYWLEYRTPTGQDAWLGESANGVQLQPGVILRRDLGRNYTSLLDGSPSPSSAWLGDFQTALPVGQPVAVAGGDLRITVQSMTDTAATVWIGTAAGRAASGNPSRPVGNLEGVSVDAWGSSISIRGWALDRDTPTDVLSMHLVVDGRGVALPAAGNRTDVGRAFPGAGNAHGFDHTVNVTAGAHRVCAFAIDSAGSGHTALGCRAVTVWPRPPIGSLDAVTSTGATVTVSGWALDRDTPAAALRVHLYIDGRGTAISAAGNRFDVGRVFPPAGSAHGFSYSTQLSAGPHRVCAFAIDTAGVRNASLGCRTVTVVPYRPTGQLDEVSVSGQVITVRGWAFDPDTPTAPVRAHVYIGRSGFSLSADGARPDVGRVHPAAGADHGYALEHAVPAGTYRVCAYGIDSAGAGSTLLGCRTVIV